MMKSRSVKWATLAAVCACSTCTRTEPASTALAEVASAPAGPEPMRPLPPDGAADDRQPVAGQGIDMGQFIIAPAQFIGYTVEGTATVGKLISDRAFWLIDGDNEVLAVMREDLPAGARFIGINSGQRIRFEGVALTANAAPELTGKLSPQIRAAIEKERDFIALHWSDIRIVDRAKDAGLDE